MTGFKISQHKFNIPEIQLAADLDSRYMNWPVVYTLANDKHVYVGETRNFTSRAKQHFVHSDKSRLDNVRIVLDDTFNKSVCLDLESFLIRMLAGDGNYTVLNRNEGVVDSDYYDRIQYQPLFDQIFAELRSDGVFTRSIPEIENSDLFKLSPFKALNTAQSVTVTGMVEALTDNASRGQNGTYVVQGQPGTGKTIVAIYLMKLLRDIASYDPTDDVDADTAFSELFTEMHRDTFRTFRIGLVIPQQSLRSSVQSVFKQTPGLSREMVMSPFDVGTAEFSYDLLIVDEAHRLSQRANQPAASLNKKFSDINLKLFDQDDPELTQLDWMHAKAKHCVFMVDAEQSVRPADVSSETLNTLIDTARVTESHFELPTQMRVKAGDNYIQYVQELLSGKASNQVRTFEGYDLRFYRNLTSMVAAIQHQERQHTLSRIVAGYAWKWVSKKDKSVFDIYEDGVKLRWNTSTTDWINSPNSLYEAGSIHTVQGYDLNYAGVIIGRDLRMDSYTGEVYFDRSSYFDVKGKENNARRGIVYSDADILRYIVNIYSVLMTRGVRGTYVYACDPVLREYLASRLP